MNETDESSEPHIRAFLLADIRGYTEFTEEHGDEAAGALCTVFAAITRDVVGAYGGQVTELRGDEALAVFASTRRALQAAVALDSAYARHSQEHPDLPLAVGIGLDAGEAAPAEGGYRGKALNLAARLCGAAGPGEILTTAAVAHLAGTVEGVTLRPGGEVEVKGFRDRIQVMEVVTANAPARRELPPAAARSADSDDFGDRIEAAITQHLARAADLVESSLQSQSVKPMEVPNPPVPPSRLPVGDDGLTTAFKATLVGLASLVLLVVAIVLIVHLLASM